MTLSGTMLVEKKKVWTTNMKKVLTALLCIILLSTSFVFALNEGTFVINRPEDLEAEKEALEKELEVVYIEKGIAIAEEENKLKLEEQERQFEDIKATYDAQIEQIMYKLTNLEMLVSQKYEDYVFWLYSMTEDQFMEFCAVVQAEGMSYRNQVAITQTAINLAIEWGGTPYYWMCQSGAYTTPTTNPILQSTIDNVLAVFKDGARVTSRPIKFFYSYIMMPEGSAWHENQTYVMTIDDHHFFE